MADTYDIRYAPEAANDIRGLRAFERANVIEAIGQHLAHEATRVSRSRIKRMVQPFWSQYRLREEEFRVYYDVDEPGRIVNVLRELFKGTAATPQEKP